MSFSIPVEVGGLQFNNIATDNNVLSLKKSDTVHCNGLLDCVQLTENHNQNKI